MTSSKASKAARHISAEAAASLVQSGMWLDYGFGIYQPDVFDKALAARMADLRGIKVRACITMRPRAHLEAKASGEHALGLNWHFGGYDRRQHDAGLVNYLPLNLGEWPDLYRRFIDRVDIAVFQVCPKDSNGFYNFSASASYLRALLERADIVIVEGNPSLPYCLGQKNAVHESDIDYIIEGDGRPPAELPQATETETDLAIARLVAAEIRYGDCLQIGIGGLPNAVCSALIEAGAKDLGINTEMMVDGLVDLVKAGLASGARK